MCYVRTTSYRLVDHGPWVLQDVNYNVYLHLFPNSIKEALVEEKYEWDSDNDNVLGNEDRGERLYYVISILGFHPFKEVIFLCQSLNRGLAYHWNSSKVQDLGTHGSYRIQVLCRYLARYRFFFSLHAILVVRAHRSSLC